jgi:hypothetical protein
MGYTRSSSSAWYGSSSSMRSDPTKTFDTLYTVGSHKPGSVVDPLYDPAKIGVRESKASAANPKPTPIIVALDCTGSMGSVLAEAMKGMGALMGDIYDHEPVTDPHIMAMVFDDIAVGAMPALQATQFESDVVILDQLPKLYLTRNGGGNSFESYHLPLYFALHQTDCDAFADGRKGFLFTIGDEQPPQDLTKDQLKAVFGPDFSCPGPYSYTELLDSLSENWHVFHVIVEEGSHMRSYRDIVIQQWTNILGQRAILLADITKLPEVIAATIRVIAGADAATVASSYDAGTAVVVAKAIKDLVPAGDNAGSDVVRL